MCLLQRASFRYRYVRVGSLYPRLLTYHEALVMSTAVFRRTAMPSVGKTANSGKM
jgi:hypothetical protein